MSEIVLRRTMLYVPGASQGMLEKSATLDSDGVLLDLEDAVFHTQKRQARERVVWALRTLPFGHKELGVRINSLKTPFGREDLEAVVPARPSLIVLPKVNSPEDVAEADMVLCEVEGAASLPHGSTRLMLLIETPHGMANAFSIASSSKRIVALQYGAADFTTEMRGRITRERTEQLYPLYHLLLAARMAKVQAIDTPYFDVHDLDGLCKHATLAADMGYDGKAIIHPSHIEPVNRIFAPSPGEIDLCERIVAAYETARAEPGHDRPPTVDGRLVEHLNYEHALRRLAIAEKAGLYRASG